MEAPRNLNLSMILSNSSKTTLSDLLLRKILCQLLGPLKL